MDQAATPNIKSKWLFTVNANVPAAVTDLVGGANLPVAANEIGLVKQRVPNHLFLQLWGESGQTYKLLVAGVQQNADDDSYEVADLLEVDVLCRTAAGGKQVLGDTLYPAMTHSVVRNATNLKVLDGDAGTKCSGGLLVDALGFTPIAIRVNCAAGPKKANIAFRCM